MKPSTLIVGYGITGKNLHREIAVLNPDTPYWDSHCLNKDVRAIAETQNAEFLKSVISFNEKQK
jgi:hypothetical protein